jgi:hypothetical protein
VSLTADLTAQWALFGKRRRDTEDYRVLETSRDQLAPSAYEQLIRRHLPGTPPHDAGDQRRPDALPWVWFGPAEEASLGLAVLDLGKPEDKDFVGRRTDPTRYFRLDWSKLADVRPSYADLARALRPVELPAPNGEPVRFAVEPVDRQALADTVERLGFDRVAVITALLLEGPVALISSERLTVEERLAFLDAIAALLPYGLRADLAASTWADPTARLRLNFGSRARQDQRSVEWGLTGVPAGPAGDPVAVAYLRLLHVLKQRHHTGLLVEFLATEASPLRFDAPEQALQRLQGLDRPFVAWNDVHAGRGAPAAVRSVLRADQVHGLSATELHDLVDFLLSAGDRSDLEAIERHWRPELLPRLSAAVANILGEPGGIAGARPYIALAARQDGLDRLLTDMMAWQGAFDRGGRPSEIERAQQLELVQPYLEAPAPGDLPELRATLVAQPAIVYDVLERTRPEILTGQASAMTAWLADGRELPRELRPLGAVLAGDPVDEDDLRALWQLGPRHVRTLLALAIESRMPVTVLPAVWRGLPSLIEAEELPSGERQAWLGTIAQLATVDIGTATQVRLDLLSLLLDGRPIHPFDQLLAGDVDDYLGQFHKVYWDREIGHVRPRLANLLVRYVTRLRWTQPASLADNVLGLLRTVADPTPPPGSQFPNARDLQLPSGLLDEVLDLISDGIRRDAGVSELEQYRRWWERLMKQSPRHASKARAAVEYQSIGEENSIEEVAASSARVLLGMPADPDTAIDSIVRRLRTPPFFEWTEHFEVFLYLLRFELRRGGMDRASILSVDRSFVHAAVEGRLGNYLATAYPRHLADFPDELIRVAGIVEAIGGRLLPEEFERLQGAGKQFESRMKQARGSGHKPRRFRRGDRL